MNGENNIITFVYKSWKVRCTGRDKLNVETKMWWA